MRFFLVVAALVATACLPQRAQGASYGNCTAGPMYFCPTANCGNGSMVRDCVNCQGFQSSDERNNICFDRRLFQKHDVNPTDYEHYYHFLWNDLVGMVVWFITAGISIACGVGGGGIYVPLAILLFKFGPKQASGFSQASIFGASLAGLIINTRSRHPVETIRHDPGTFKDGYALPQQQPTNLTKHRMDSYVNHRGGKFYTRPIIHYDMALFMSPMQMSGAVLGVIIQRLLPNWLYLLIAAVVLSYASYRTYRKYFTARKAENAKRQQDEETEQGNNIGSDEDDPDSSSSSQHTNNHHQDNLENGQPEEEEDAAAVAAGENTEEQPSSEEEEEMSKRRIRYLEEDMRQYPKEKIGALVVLWIGLFILTLMKGGKGVGSFVGINCQSTWYIVLIVCQFLWLFGFALYFGRRLVRNQQARVQVRYPFLEDDPLWDGHAMRFYGGMTFIAGIIAALIGIGGGMVLGPLMLIMGINPRISTATNAMMIVITSSSIAIMFVISGLVPYSYALFYFAICFCGAWVGKSKIDAWVKRTGRASILIFLLGSIIAFATVGCAYIFFHRLTQRNWCFDGFNPFCNLSNSNANCSTNRMLNIISGGPDL